MESVREAPLAIASIEQPVRVDEQDVFVGASVGIAMAPTDANAAAERLRYADIALYEAKAGGHNTWRFYAGDMNARIIERRRLESDLRFAIKHGELRLHFQPRYRLSDRQMVGAEALARWQHPERGLIPSGYLPRHRRGKRPHRRLERLGARNRMQPSGRLARAFVCVNQPIVH
jgi:predicted signal transduction protein with EAL and GGDEF domain